MAFRNASSSFRYDHRRLFALFLGTLGKHPWSVLFPFGLLVSYSRSRSWGKREKKGGIAEKVARESHERGEEKRCCVTQLRQLLRDRELCVIVHIDVCIYVDRIERAVGTECSCRCKAGVDHGRGITDRGTGHSEERSGVCVTTQSYIFRDSVTTTSRVPAHIDLSASHGNWLLKKWRPRQC